MMNEKIFPYYAPFLLGAFNAVRPKDKLSNINIEKEYQLIKEKRSTLSSSMRAMVVRRYEAKNKGE